MTNELIDLAQKVSDTIGPKKLMLAAAESCTGGGIAYTLTAIPGSGDWFDCGFVTYSNTAKNEMLDVPDAVIAQFGAVSEEVAAAMAAGAVANSNADIGVSTTGIAGPTGAVPGKPIGTVCFGWARGDHVHTERLVFPGDREAVRVQAIAHALRGILRFVE